MMTRALSPWRIQILLLVLIALPGCGWQLRTAPDMGALPVLALSGAGHDLRHELTEALDNAGVRVEATSDWTLAFSRESWTKRTVATDTRGRAAERELRLNLEWRLEPGGDQRPGPRRELTLTRTFQYSPTDATTSSDEEDLLRESMYRDAVWQILRQIEATASQLPLNGEESDAATR